MFWKWIGYTCILLLNIKITLCNVCSPMNFGNTQSVINNMKELLKPFNFEPLYNSSEILDYPDIIREFQNGKDNEDINLNITQYVTKYKYPVEQHEVVTEDGYIHKIFRIPVDGPVVFLMPGVCCSSFDFLSAGSNALGFFLADAGFDVWFGNNRGNIYSRKHQSLSPDCAEFWDFSFHEIGLYDIPAMIDYVLSTTGESKVLYVGHSQGNTAIMVTLSERPEYNEKISLTLCLSAVVFMDDILSPLFHIINPLTKLGEVITKVLGIYEIGARDAFMDAITATFCGSPESAEIVCNNILFVTTGFDYPQTNAKQLPVVFSNYPSGASMKQAFHYGLNTGSQEFRQYDYGYIENKKRYGTIEPPEYPLEKVTCPVAIFYSVNDRLTSDVDTYRLIIKLPNIIEFYHVPYPKLNHFDYLIAKNAKELVFQEVKRLLSKYIPI